MSSSLRSLPRFLPVALLLVLASTLAVLQVADLEAASDSASGVPLKLTEPVSPLGGSCFFHGIPICSLCRPCPENCIQLCNAPEICQCGCVGCIDEGGNALATAEPAEPQASYTLPPCSNYRGKACTQEQGLRRCLLAPGEPGICWCPDGTWHCG